MAIQPSKRPNGSSYRLRFSGLLVVQAGQQGDPQTSNGVFAPGADTTPAAGTLFPIRFALADMTDLTDTQKRLPASSYDYDGPDTTLIGSNDWAQNVIVRAYEGDDTAKDPATSKVFSFIDYLLPSWERDTASSGLRQNTGVPVLKLNCYATGNAMPDVGTGSVPIVVDIWFPPSAIR